MRVPLGHSSSRCPAPIQPTADSLLSPVANLASRTACVPQHSGQLPRPRQVRRDLARICKLLNLFSITSERLHAGRLRVSDRGLETPLVISSARRTFHHERLFHETHDHTPYLRQVSQLTAPQSKGTQELTQLTHRAKFFFPRIWSQYQANCLN